VAVLNSEQRSPAFVRFMRARAGQPQELEESLVPLVLERLDSLRQRYTFAAVLALPSRTWSQREWTAHIIAKHLGIPLHLDALSWETEPEHRQGQLTNNDQRKQNVAGRMSLAGQGTKFSGTVLLLDDYVGSAATLKEAGRCLHASMYFDGELVPFTIARVRWRLGSRGMI
jgi:ATP-dependent DNA helicase RecQ